MEVTIRQLEYLVALAETENFGRAAEQCFVTQPALSAQMAQLEKTLGIDLIERGRKATLTPAGEAAVARAREILEDLRRLRDETGSFLSPLTGRIRLGALPTVAPYLLPSAMPALRQAYPRMQLELHEAPARELAAAFASGSMDLLLTTLGEDLGPTEEWKIMEDPFLLLAPESHPLHTRRSLAQADLVGQPLLLLEGGHGLNPQILEACALRAGPNASDFRASSLRTLVGMVASGIGITLMPELAADAEVREGSGLKLSRFETPEPKREIGLVWRRGAIRSRDYRVLGQALKKSRD
jgi:LysR family hydrogen peroxide-inducible transcriptional activator